MTAITSDTCLIGGAARWRRPRGQRSGLVIERLPIWIPREAGEIWTSVALSFLNSLSMTCPCSLVPSPDPKFYKSTNEQKHGLILISVGNTNTLFKGNGSWCNLWHITLPSHMIHLYHGDDGRVTSADWVTSGLHYDLGTCSVITTPSN